MEIILNKDNFQKEVLESEVPVVVDFWAEWCGPCKIMGPIISEVAKEYEGKAKIGKVDVDANNELAQQYNIMSIPTMKVFVGGKVAGEIVGAVPKNTLTAAIDSHLGN